MPVDRQLAERAISEFLRALGRDPEKDPELVDTPRRVAEAFANELLAGYDVDVDLLLEEGAVAAPEARAASIVVVRDIAVATTCPHHLMPALGSATVAYLPGSRWLGLGTIAELVDAYARRLTLQEQIGENVVRALCAGAGARGAFCQLTLRHSCLSARGKHRDRASVTTVTRDGVFNEPTWSAELSQALAASRRV
jgi:GTP cyclohydrolase I